MLQCKVANQLQLLLWKNFTLKKRHPFTLTVEIILPLFIIFIVVAVRSRNLQSRYDRCYLHEKTLASTSVFLYFRDLVCFFNTTCSKYDTIDWTNKEDNFTIFVRNISEIYESIFAVDVTVAGLTSWSLRNTDKIDMINGVLEYGNELYSKLQLVIDFSQQISNGYYNRETAVNMSKWLCNSDQNDFAGLLDQFGPHIIKSRKKRSSSVLKSCQEDTFKFLNATDQGKYLWKIVNPIVWGPIYYSPVSEFTREIIRRSNVTFKSLDYLRLVTVEWRLRFRNQFEKELINGSLGSSIRFGLTICRLVNISDLNQICNQVSTIMDPNNLVSKLDDVSKPIYLIEQALNCTNLDRFVPLDTLENLNKSESMNAYAGLEFGEASRTGTINLPPTFINYSIRMSTASIDSTKDFKVLDAFWKPSPRISTILHQKYYTSSFLNLQQSIATAFTELLTSPESSGSRNHNPVSVGATIQLMPYPCYTEDKFLEFLSTLIPLLLVISFSPTFTFLIKAIVVEKEKRLKEFMCVMGLSNSVHWLAWFVTDIILLTLISTLFTIIIRYSNIFQHSSAAVIFIVFFSYSVAIICQAFLFSVLFDNANIAAVVGGVLYFIFYLPFIVTMQTNSKSLEFLYAISLLAQVSFCNAFSFMSNWEQSNDGAQFSNIFSSEFDVAHCVIMMWVDSLVYLLFALYLEAVHPGQYGLPRPWYFPCTSQFWCSSTAADPELKSNSDKSSHKAASKDVEEEPRDLEMGISIRGLCKTYGSSQEPAVDKLSLNFYQSQITAFLGHNGAGKTTTISMLTGIVPASAGTALILGHDIRTDMDSARELIGLCPQHNILFDSLTVADHVYFYGMLKGLPRGEIEQQLPRIVAEVGLSRKVNTYAKRLSGGMKRKLSIAMAFIGNSQVVFLDEPTAGVDPFARRGIWDMLVRYRDPTRTIILTTHHMDEADYLADRIAIISRGRLRCAGSSVFLKRAFGDGFYLTLEKSVKLQKRYQGGTDNTKLATEAVAATARVLEFVVALVPSACLVDENRGAWTLVLPVTELPDNNNSGNQGEDHGGCVKTEAVTSNIPALLSALDCDMDQLQVASYGVTDTSLEEVFLKVTEKVVEDGEVPTVRRQPVANYDGSLSLDEQNVVQMPVQSEEAAVADLDLAEATNRVVGALLVVQQFIGLQAKRFHYTKRNVKGFFSELILPLILILLIMIVLKIVNIPSLQPAMMISPWLMKSNTRSSSLSTFYRLEPPSVLNKSDTERLNELAAGLTSMYRTDLGQSGLRCMNRAIYALPEWTCQPSSSAAWSPKPANVSLRSPDCDCDRVGTQTCANPASGGPTPSSRTMRSSDTLINLSHYNISDHLSKKFKQYAKKLYGGFQFLFPSSFGVSSKILADSNVWSLGNWGLRVNSSLIYYLRGFLNISAQKTSYARIWVNSKGYVSMPAYANVLDNLLLRYHISQTNIARSSNMLPSSDIAKYGIAVFNHPFKYSVTDVFTQLQNQMYEDLSVATFVILALSLVPASFIIFLVEERATGSKRQQFVSGVSPYVYWCCTFFWDIMKFTVPVLCIIVIFAAFNYESYICSKNLGAFITLLLIYGFGVIPHMYPFTFLFKVPSTAFVIVYSYNVLIGIVTTVLSIFLDFIELNDISIKPLNDVLKKVFLIFPQFCLGRGMLDLSSKYHFYKIGGDSFDYQPMSWVVIGDKLCSLLVLFVGWFAVLFLMESGLIHRRLRGLLQDQQKLHLTVKADPKVADVEDEDVDTERQFIASSDPKCYALKVKGLTKVYETGIQCSTSCCKKKATADPEDDGERRKLAVNNISFGVADGECFGLLGVNGAGKTTTFKMLTGEELMSGGEAHINGVSVTADMVAAHRNMGFCPQFDSLHSLLTASEELRLYCRLRGVRPELAPAVVERSLVELNLSSHRHKVSSALSGGNKRKLSTAIALIGSPKVIFLDEPTAGMDAGARRFLWRRIQHLTGSHGKGGSDNQSSQSSMSAAGTHAVVLTSHNMEECEVLCNRLAIMVDGRIKCIGTVPHLKARFGNDYQIKVRISEDQSRQRVKDLIHKNSRGTAMLQDENFITILYRFDHTVVNLATLFAMLLSMKKDGLILDFSLTQTTLDEIFVNFAKEKRISRLLSIPHRLSSVNNDNQLYSGVQCTNFGVPEKVQVDDIFVGFVNNAYDGQDDITDTTSCVSDVS